MEALHEVVHRYIDMGFAPVPVEFKTKACKINEWQKLKLTHEDVLGAFSDFPSNIGIVLGQLSGGLVDIDLDCDEAIALAPHMLPETGMIFGRESKPRSHWIYKAADSCKSLRFSNPDGGTLVELRADGGMTVFPGSMHISGEKIRFDKDYEPAQIESNQLALSARHLAAASLLFPYWRKGQRHNLALVLAGTLLTEGIDAQNTERFFNALIRATHDQEAEDRYGCLESTTCRLECGQSVSRRTHLAEMIGKERAARFCDWLGLKARDPDALIQRAASILKTADVEPVPESDTANAERFAVLNRDRARYSHDIKKWLLWNGFCWTIDRDGELDRLAHATVRALAIDAVNGGDKTGLAWAARSHDRSRLQNMIALAQSRCSVRSEAFDADPWKLNCRSGIIDLRTGELLPHDPEALMRRLAPVSFDAGAKCPNFFGFLDRIFAQDAELIGFLQRAIGYSLTGKTGEQCLFVLVGNGANGKSTLIHIVQELLGDYAQQTPMETLMVSKANGINNDIARLEGARFVSAVEAEAGQRLAEAKIKQLTGGDRIAARFLYGEHFEFLQHFKLWLATNKLPEIRGTDEGIWRRFRVIPFGVTIPEAERDRELPDKLKAELPAILNWAVQGCLEWQRDGLRPPAKVTDATKAYRAEMDVVAQFVEDCCIEARDVSETVKVLFDSYSEWCGANGEIPISKRAFGQRLGERGHDETRTGRARKRRGIRLKTETELLTIRELAEPCIDPESGYADALALMPGDG